MNVFSLSCKRFNRFDFCLTCFRFFFIKYFSSPFPLGFRFTISKFALFFAFDFSYVPFFKAKLSFGLFFALKFFSIYFVMVCVSFIPIYLEDFFIFLFLVLRIQSIQKKWTSFLWCNRFFYLLHTFNLFPLLMLFLLLTFIFNNFYFFYHVVYWYCLVTEEKRFVIMKR